MSTQAIEEIRKKLLELGAVKTAVLPISEIPFEPEFRTFCESNACGKYKTSWSCPPHAGEVEDLIAHANSFSAVLVYQTIGEIEDSYDIEGMLEAGKVHEVLTRKIKNHCKDFGLQRYECLGSGSCDFCAECTAPNGEPCRFPEELIVSIDAYTVYVAELAKRCDMKYTNGENTVTYFGMVLMSE
ncbi:MAG: DUF2284 domain-containing protein [Bacillota bacterium]